ncbi:hypothetical protein [Ralstonia sp. ASV6]|uniref:hypothetical protein n=1 Tax=Ralstonia sp. ASV6 TaxID=2795124 RepID=UPI0018EA3367|nr:hypothetical protein [Ralstonia sp. ASV6]
MIFLTGYGAKEWDGFWHAAHVAGRAAQCYADLPFGTTEGVDLLDLVDRGAVLYFGEEWQARSGVRASRRVSDVLAAALRHESSRRPHHLMVIFDGFDPWLDLRLLQPLADMTKVSLVSSSHMYWAEGADMPRSTCQVVFQHDKDWVMCDPQGRWLPPPMTLRPGEAIVVSRQPPPNPPLAVKISIPALAPSPKIPVDAFRPVNTVEMATQSS